MVSSSRLGITQLEVARPKTQTTFPEFPPKKSSRYLRISQIRKYCDDGSGSSQKSARAGDTITLPEIWKIVSVASLLKQQ